MDTPHYRFDFGDVCDGWVPVRFMKERNAEYTFSVGIRDAQFAHLAYGRLPHLLADMIDLGLSVYIADRFSTRRTQRPCFITVCLAVRNVAHFSQPAIQEQLRDVLYFLTRDDWSFEFVARKTRGRASEHQMTLLNTDQVPREVALWSGGLDALAGTYTRLTQASPDSTFTLFGTGGNHFIHHVQRRVYQASVTAFAHSLSLRPISSRLQLVQVPIDIRGTKTLPKNAQARARGFIFLWLGALCALLEQQHTLHVYENGIGAINLPYRASEVGLDHSRAVHPRTIRMMQHLVSLVTDTAFSLRNPFEWQTKAQVCERLVHDQITTPIGYSITCDRRRRAIPMQCGCCSSCLLRRQALITLGFQEPRERYLVTSHPELFANPRDVTHLHAMVEQVRILQGVLASADPWNALVYRYPDLSDIVDDVTTIDPLPLEHAHAQVLRLYTRYCEEWEQVKSFIWPRVNTA